MLGVTGDAQGAAELGEQAGMIPRALELLFRSREAAKAAGWRYTFRASMLEVYCEELLDLLAPGAAGLRGAQVADWDKAAASASGGARALEVRHDEASGVTVVEGATSVEVGSAQEVAELLQRAAAARATGRTTCNARSSRSHLVMSLRLDGDNELTGASSRGALHLVDLAGSERLSRSGAAGDSLKETQAINKSLSALGDVIAALAAHAPHVPYRNSKLTWLLAGALGGDAKTLMLVNIAPGREAAPETLCSLRFAAKVNSVELATQKRCGELAGPGAAIAAKAAAAKKAAK
jgi:kinesin family protein C1